MRISSDLIHNVGMFVNEISYPSHLSMNSSECCSFQRLLEGYRKQALAEISPGGKRPV
jgi:hypothetical protein